MLCLTRRMNESITINIPPANEWRTIEVLVQPDPQSGDRIRLGFDTVPEIQILRTELLTPDGPDPASMPASPRKAC